MPSQSGLQEPDFARHIAHSYSHHADKYIAVLEPTLTPMAEEIVRRAEVQPGQRILDLACGTGLVTRALAQLSSAVHGADLSRGILKLAREQSHDQIPFSAADAHHLPFAADCFDSVTCGLSLSHFWQIETALAEIKRILHPGGRLIASAWGTKRQNPSRDAAVEVRGRYLPDRETIFGGRLNEDLWADVDAGRQALERAGFVNVRSATSSLSGRYTDHAAAAEASLAWPITRYQISLLAAEDRENLRKATEAAVRRESNLEWWIEVHYYEGIHADESS